MIQDLDHIGIAVHDLDEAVRLWRDVIGLRFEGIEEVLGEGVRVAMMRAGEVRLELLEPLRDDSAIAKFLESRGPGVHHLALRVGDGAEALERLKEKGLKVLDDVPRAGAHGTKVVFVHPKSLNGVLAELVEVPDES